MKTISSSIHSVLVFVTLVLIGFACVLTARRGSVHATWGPNGIVSAVEPGSRAAAELLPGDQILFVDGTPTSTSWQSLNGKPVGARIVLTVERAGQVRDVTLPIEAPSAAESTGDWAAQILAILFWAAAWAAVRSAPRSEQSRSLVLVGLFFASVGVLLSFGATASYSPAWLIRTYGLGLWVVGPIGTWLHLHFPKAHRLGRSRLVIAGLVGSGLIGLVWAWAAPPDYPGSLNQAVLSAAYGWFALHVVLSIALNIWGWRSSPTLAERRQLGVVAVGALLALVPLFLAALIPAVLARPDLLNLNAVMLMLALLPASYTYALLRHKRMTHDRALARLLVYAFTVAAIAMLVALVFTVPGIWALPREYLVGIAILVGALAAWPASQVIERGLGWLLFGRLRQPLQSAAKATDAIDLSIDSDDLTAQVTRILKAQLDIEQCAILILDDHQRLADPSHSGQAMAAEGLEIKEPSALGRLLSADSSVLEFDHIRPQLEATPGRVLLGVAWAQLLLPLRTQGRLIGLLLTRYRAGAGFLDEEDIIVLKLVAQALATALQRRALLAELRDKNAEASELSHELMRVRAEERKRIARDLHDDIIQPMIATSYTVAVMADPGAEGVRQTLTELIDRTRTICFELREPALDNLGFGAAARAVLSAHTKRSGRAVTARIAESAAASVPEPISAAALGILDESLTNATKHGGAQAIAVDIGIVDQVLTLTIRDDGVGFDVAEARQRAAQTRHFGLAIMEERAASVGGQLTVVSSPGRGSMITGRFPLVP